MGKNEANDLAFEPGCSVESHQIKISQVRTVSLELYTGTPSRENNQIFPGLRHFTLVKVSKNYLLYHLLEMYIGR